MSAPIGPADDLASGLAWLERAKDQERERITTLPADRIRARAQRLWFASDLRCAVTLGGFAVNGYVQLPEGHPDLGRGYQDIDVDVHGGLTYGVDRFGWLGFDTGHAFDVWTDKAIAPFLDGEPDPAMGHEAREVRRIMAESSTGRYISRHDIRWTADRLYAEVEHLAAQLRARVAR